eukprot:646531-Prorocentrum_minimum.AAC.1
MGTPHLDGTSIPIPELVKARFTNGPRDAVYFAYNSYHAFDKDKEGYMEVVKEWVRWNSWQLSYCQFNCN